MEVKVSKTRDGILLSGALPAEISDSPALEVFPLKDGAYLLTVKGFAEKEAYLSGLAAKKGGKALAEGEKALVRKLLSVRFESRIPEQVERVLSKEEKETLSSLMKKGLVQVFHGGKYEKTGVYNVSDFAFNSVREPSALPAAPGQMAAQQPLPVSSYAHLEKFGWMVLDDENAARAFANAYPEKVKSGEVRGMRAFDRKYYFVTRGFAEEWEKKVQLSLAKSDKAPEEISEELGIAPGGCRCLLLHLCESGEVMEKKKGKFAKA